MAIKGDPWKAGYDHEYVMYCTHCNKKQYDKNNISKMIACPDCGTWLVDIDVNLEDIVVLLNKEYNTPNGKIRPFRTLQSCEGHWIDINTNSIPYITLIISKQTEFPLSMLEELTAADISFNIDMNQFDNEDEVKNEMGYIMAINGESHTNPRRILNISMNMDFLKVTMKDEREFPGYAEKTFNRRKKIFLDQLKEFATNINTIYESK